MKLKNLRIEFSEGFEITYTEKPEKNPKSQTKIIVRNEKGLDKWLWG